MSRAACIGMLLATLWLAGLSLLASTVAQANGVASHAQALEPAPPLLQQAIASYRSAQQTATRADRVAAFRRAQRLFEAAAAQGRPSADLLANIGAAALQAEDPGAAILALRRALVLEPWHARARSNLQQARSLLDPAVPRPPSSPENALPRRVSQLPATAPASVWALGGLLAGLAAWRRSRALGLAALALLLLAGALRWLPQTIHRGDGRADAVLVAEAPAYAADSLHAPLRYARPLPPGTEVEIVEQRAEWLRIRLADGTEAWVTAGSAEAVRPAQASELASTRR